MGRNERDFANPDDTDDYRPGTVVLGVERRKTPEVTANPTRRFQRLAVRDATTSSAIPEDPVTDRNGRAPNPPISASR